MNESIKRKSYKELSFSDDFMFSNILRNNLDICKELIELILNKKVGKIELSEREKDIKITADGKGVRLDTYFEDDMQTVYDLEMQTVVVTNLPRRSRYYHGMIDLNLINMGANYNKLKNSYVIFICTFDYFGKGLPVYEFVNTCKRDFKLELNDGTHTVFVNAQSTDESMTPQLRDFLGYLCGEAPNSPLTDRIQREVIKGRENHEWEVTYMHSMIREQDCFMEGLEQGRSEGLEQGRSEGLEQGRSEGLAQGEIKATLEFYAMGVLTEELVMEKLNLKSKRELEALLADHGLAKSPEGATEK